MSSHSDPFFDEGRVIAEARRMSADKLVEAETRLFLIATGTATKRTIRKLDAQALRAELASLRDQLHGQHKQEAPIRENAQTDGAA